MGTGKTVVGKLLSEKLGKEFLELDWLIEEQAGKSIPDIFKESGEIGFRELEIEVTKQVAGRKNVVIACGGGIVLNKINTDRLRQNGVTVCLTAKPEVILERVSVEQGQRPLLEVEDQLKTIKEMLKLGEDLGVFSDKKAQAFLYETLLKKRGSFKSCKKAELIRVFLESGVDLDGKVPAEILAIGD